MPLSAPATAAPNCHLSTHSHTIAKALLDPELPRSPEWQQTQLLSLRHALIPRLLLAAGHAPFVLYPGEHGTLRAVISHN